MKILKIHFAYIVTFLILVIILLLTVEWGSIKELTNYLTFALTITSLVLALLAIVYSFFSNSSMTRNISNLEDASKKISSNSELLNSATKKLEESLGDIPKQLKNIEHKTENTLIAFEEFSKKEIIIDKTKSKKSENIDSNEIGKLLSKRGSIASKGMLLGLKLAYESKKSFNLKDFAEKVDLTDISYLNGFLVGMSSIGVFKYDEIKLPDNKWNWHITYLDPNIISEIENSIKEIIKEYEGEEHMNFVAEGFERIRNYFKK